MLHFLIIPLPFDTHHPFFRYEIPYSYAVLTEEFSHKLKILHKRVYYIKNIKNKQFSNIESL